MSQENSQNQDIRKKCPACNQEYVGSIRACKQDGEILVPVSTVENLIGTTLANAYLIESVVGVGGMSVVYKGKHQLMDRTVAIKMLQAQLVNDETSIKRFQQEAQAASCLTHPNVITVYDFGITASGQPYLIMDFLVGDSLADIIKRDNHVDPVRALPIFIQACDALEHAHRKRVLHRDLKAGNIMVIDLEGKTDVVKLVDFGIAKMMPGSGKQISNLTRTGMISAAQFI